jgi:hypothetical protein
MDRAQSHVNRALALDSEEKALPTAWGASYCHTTGEGKLEERRGMAAGRGLFA